MSGSESFSQDQALQTSIRKKLQEENVSGLDSLQISVSNGVVTLAGSVKSQEEAQRIVGLVRSITEVKSITNNLKVSEQ